MLIFQRPGIYFLFNICKTFQKSRGPLNHLGLTTGFLEPPQRTTTLQSPLFPKSLRSLTCLSSVSVDFFLIGDIKMAFILRLEMWHNQVLCHISLPTRCVNIALVERYPGRFSSNSSPVEKVKMDAALTSRQVCRFCLWAVQSIFRLAPRGTQRQRYFLAGSTIPPRVPAQQFHALTRW